jgi:beta-glucanase (GH16 family)
MKKTISALLVALGWLCCAHVSAQFLLLDDMEGHGPCSGRWTYYAGNTTTGKVQFGVANPQTDAVNSSPLVAKFIKDTSCFEYMSAGCTLTQPFVLTGNSVFKMLVYCSTKDDIMFKLQPGNDYSKAVYFTYKVSQVNRWEEATFNFQSVKNRTDFTRIEVHYIDGKKASGLLYFDLVQGPNPTTIRLKDTAIAMGQENGASLLATLRGDTFKLAQPKSAWHLQSLPPGVSLDTVLRLNDSTVRLLLAGNSPANYSRTELRVITDSPALKKPNSAYYTATGKVTLAGNPNWTMIYSDEFNTPGRPDASKWYIDPRPKGWINGEQQVYTDSTRDNVRVRNGSLVITGKKDFPTGNSNEPWSSGRVISQNKMDFRYGKVEVRARLPKARGSWPAIWLMPTNSAYGAWPQSGEIDIMEHVGNKFGTVLSTIHTQSHNWTNGGEISSSRKIMDADTVFHVYGMDWSEDSIQFIYDGVPLFTYANPHTDWKDWPFDQPFHVILNVAIGGGMGGSITEADWPDSMLVDYVRIYQKGLGTPYLDSMALTPASATVLPGKTQQYTAKGWDQNGFPIPVTNAWSISGTGNTISSTGLATIQSSGTVTVVATADSGTVTRSVPVTTRPVNYKPIPARIEAEAFDNSNTCCTEVTADTSGNRNISYIATGSWMEYDISVPTTGQYRLQLRAAVNSSAGVQLLLDTAVLTSMLLPVSGGWQTWSTVTSAPFTLTAGQQTVRLYSQLYGWNFNWLAIVRADSIQLNRLVLQPDSVRLYTGDSAAFTVKAYDQYQNRLLLNGQPNWQVYNTANQVSATGVYRPLVPGTDTVIASIGSVRGTAVARATQAPVLTRIVLTPDSALVPVGASFAFTVKGYDQRDSLYRFTPVWYPQGTGNRITTAGIYTAGSTPGTYLLRVTDSSGTFSDTASVTVAYTCTVNARYEAESASSYDSGPWLENTNDTSGVKNFAGLATGDWFAYSNLNVPVTGRYRVSLRVRSTAAARVKVGHSGLNFGEIAIPNTNNTWRTVSDTMTLPALTYTGIHVLSGSFRFNWFRIDNCAYDSTQARATEALPALPATLTTEATGKTGIYPNPVHDRLQLRFPAGRYHTVLLTDLSGRVLRQWRVGTDVQQLIQPVGFLANGLYLLRLEGNAYHEVQKLVKQ